MKPGAGCPLLLLLLVKSSGIGEGGTATRVGRRKERVGEDDLTDNIPIGAKEAPSLGLLGEESRLDLILRCEKSLRLGSFFTWGKLLV